MNGKLRSNLMAFRNFWKILLVVLLGLLMLRLLPETVVIVEPNSGEGPADQREAVPIGPKQPVAGIAPSVAVGQHFASLAELTAAQEASGYVRTGSFGQSWPATVTEVQNRNDAISFTRKDGTQHNYSGFEGYRMQVVRLAGPSQGEVVVVFRSTIKR